MFKKSCPIDIVILTICTWIKLLGHTVRSMRFMYFLYNFSVCDKCINRDLYFYNKYTYAKIFIHFY